MSTFEFERYVTQQERKGRSVFIIRPPVGTPFGIEQGRLYVAPTNPGTCPGANSGAVILARRDHGDCETGGFVGVTGVTLE
jgi:hypothetical protein